MIVERVRNKRFDRGIVAALVHALSDEDSDIRRNMVEIFIAAIAQGVLIVFTGYLY
jgi:hypothetical protein